MKKIFFLLVVLFASFMFCTSIVSAEDLSDIIVSLQLDNPIMKVNGEATEIDVGKDTKPIVKDGRTLVPIRAIIEAFGGTADWESSTQSVLLKLDDDEIEMVINSKTMYVNDHLVHMDVAPIAINGRTMLPIRFIAESFGLGVAWDNDTKTVSIIRNLFEEYEYNRIMEELPAFSGEAFSYINNNSPYFKEYEIINGSFEYYSELDELGRCDVCFASIASDLMPMEERESIGAVTPSGWVNASYDNVSGGYLYNRSHLIGYQLTGENANERNLITGTRYLNVNGMLPFENKIAEYIEETGNRVMYRSTPVFTDNNLVADGVLLEAYSVEDNGKGISFCVYCYNVQPGIKINYATGESAAENEASIEIQPNYIDIIVVYRTPSGKKYHLDAECGGKNSYEVLLDDAKRAGLTPCSKCATK